VELLHAFREAGSTLLLCAENHEHWFKLIEVVEENLADILRHMLLVLPDVLTCKMFLSRYKNTRAFGLMTITVIKNASLSYFEVSTS